MNIVIVESPTKASTINKYLGADYRVVASYGHVRDLPAKSGSVRPDNDFDMDWEIVEGSEKNLREISKALKDADRLYLATDPDREGEAISWHVLDELGRRSLLNGIDVKRIVFTEITKGAVLDAMAHPRDVDDNLVNAYKARRALDYLVGFTLSPVLWRKLPGSRSAGRVQSVALRLICEREDEIEAFKAHEYWSVDTELTSASGEKLIARLTHLNGEKLDKFSLGDEAAAMAAKAAIEAGRYTVLDVETKRTKRNPAPPFTTSTLQQEASRKLGFAAKRTMRLAQQLYEGIDLNGERVGLITYMRTDGVQIAQSALDQARTVIGRDYGTKYLPEQARVYKTKAKNAQEAHEAIRPTDLDRRPDDMGQYLEADQVKLYELIWKRALASQMSSAEIDQAAVVIGAADDTVRLRATGSVIAFDGFLRLYQEGHDDNGEDNKERRLPEVKSGEALALGAVKPEQHFTEPPPRYTEASLVKELERLGIGRPSTYASILSVLQDRNYVRLEKKRFEPEDRGRIVTSFLVNFFKRYVEYDFTAALENELDDISAGNIDWRQVLTDFWVDFKGAVDDTQELRVKDVLDALMEALGPHLFPPREDGTDPRACPTCKDGKLSLKLGKFGPFIGCSNYPDCRYTRALAANGDDAEHAGARELGKDPESGLAVTLRKGPYGFYLQLGEAVEGDKSSKPKRVSLPKDVPPDTVELQFALGLLSLPREVGPHPETGKKITAGIGRFGPYVKHETTYKSLSKDDDVLTIGLNRAVSLLAEAKHRASAVLRELGTHPDDDKPITVKSGRYGPYVQHGRTNATLPKDVSEDDVTLEQALELLAAKKGKKGGKRKTAKSKSTTKTAAKSAGKSTAKSTGKKGAKSTKKSGGKSSGKKSATAAV